MKQYANREEMQAEYDRLHAMSEDEMTAEEMYEEEDLDMVLHFGMTPEEVNEDRADDAKNLMMEGAWD